MLSLFITLIFVSLSDCRFVESNYDYFEQTLDHFNPQDESTYRQRFHFQTTYCTESPSLCPIFLYICGEYSCDGIPDDYIQVLARNLKAVVVMPEHRYYGLSVPFNEFTTENLRFLSSKQAVCDLASFTVYFQKLFNEKYGLPENAENPWITFGVSYAGALSAWFRLKFPHLTRGSISSSGVVHAILAYPQFDEQVAASVGTTCSHYLRLTTASMEANLEANNTGTKQLFGARGLSDNDFLYYVADVAATSVQYGRQYELCNHTIRAFQTGQNPTVAFADYTTREYTKVFSVEPITYSQDELKKVHVSLATNNGNRQWWYQKCTEVGFFQIAPKYGSIRSNRIDLDYHRRLCSNVFLQGLWPDVNGTNLYYGGEGIAGTDIVFLNGSQDPWKHASKLISSCKETSIMISCPNCGHGVDMRGCPQHPVQTLGDANQCSNVTAVSRAREKVLDALDCWLRSSSCLC